MNAVAPALFILAVSVGLSLSACALLRRRAIQYRLVTSRDPERGGPGGVPTLGGVGVLLGLGGGCIAALALARCGGGWQGLDVSVCLPLAIILLGFAFLGALDDARGLSPLVRLLVEVGLVGVALLFMPPLWMGLDSLPGTRGLLAVFLIVTGANAFNMSDNADGLAAGTGCLSFLAAYLVPGLPGSLALAALAAAGALAGFLFWNRPPARLYLGDVGTLPLGALLACALVIRAEPLSVIQALAALLMAGYLIFDPLYAVAGRLGRGRAPWKGGVDHPSHDLRRLFGRWPPAWRLILGVHAFSVLTGWGVMIGILPSAAIPVGLLSWSALLVVAMRGRAR